MPLAVPGTGMPCHSIGAPPKLYGDAIATISYPGRSAILGTNRAVSLPYPLLLKGALLCHTIFSADTTTSGQKNPTVTYNARQELHCQAPLPSVCPANQKLPWGGRAMTLLIVPYAGDMNVP